MGSSVRQSQADHEQLNAWEYDNSLSRTLFCLGSCFRNAASFSLVAMASSYLVLRVAEDTKWVNRRRNLRWYLPGAAALIGATYGSRMGMVYAMDDLNHIARNRRLALATATEADEVAAATAATAAANARSELHVSQETWRYGDGQLSSQGNANNVEGVPQRIEDLWPR
mgnify:CR=1 FL=1|eukprot:scaffold105638_cov32-Tisochrysis_lutea.AAC.4